MNNAGFFKRLLAFILDKVILLTVLILILFTISIFIVSSENSFVPVSIFYTAFLSCLFFTPVISTIYNVLFTTKMGATPGKLLFGMKVYDSTNNKYLDKKTAFLRITAGYSFSGVLLGLGYITIFRHPENLAWHDQLFNTKVSNEKGYIFGIVLFLILIALNVFLVTNIVNTFSLLM